MSGQHQQDERRHLPLTPREEAKARQEAYGAFMHEMEYRSPPPEVDTSDLLQENKKVSEVLTSLVGWLPALLLVVMVAAILVSLDKTAAAFEASVAHDTWLFGIWTYLVALGAVVMTDLALVIVEFALVRDMLSKGLSRRVLTWREIQRRFRVLVGDEKPLDWHEMPDSTLEVYSKFLFALVMAANIYAVTKVGGIKAASDLDFESGLLLFTGIAGALSLRFIGRQLAHIVYELAHKKNIAEYNMMQEQWRDEMDRRWQVVETEMAQRALHRAYVVKNQLSLEDDSPYLLTTGEGGAIEAVPFEQSSEPLPMEWLSASRNGRDHNH